MESFDNYMRGNFNQQGGHQTTYGRHNPKAHQAVRAITALTAGGSLLVLSGLILTGTIIALIIATPLLVLFSPLLVPAAITTFLIVGGFVASGGFGVAAVSVLAWIYRYMTGKHPAGSDQLEEARMKLAGKARDVRDRAHDQFGTTHQTTTTT